MFTGIIQSTAKVRSVTKDGSVLRARVERPIDWELAIGQSIAVDGVCSTVIAFDADSFEVEYMPETLAKTTVGKLIEGSVVNLERSLTLQDFIDGSLVSGHVDAVGNVEEVVLFGETKEMMISFPSELKKYIAPKGSIVINGVSLTVVDTEGDSFRIALIPYTLEWTNLGVLTKGDTVNIEVDMLARYVVNAMERMEQSS
jgi:riboflavin synthase